MPHVHRFVRLMEMIMGGTTVIEKVIRHNSYVRIRVRDSELYWRLDQPSVRVRAVISGGSTFRIEKMEPLVPEIRSGELIYLFGPNKETQVAWDDAGDVQGTAAAEFRPELRICVVKPESAVLGDRINSGDAVRFGMWRIRAAPDRYFRYETPQGGDTSIQVYSDGSYADFVLELVA